MNVLAIISRDLIKGSTQFRIAQYLDLFHARGVTVEFVRRDAVTGGVLRHLGDYDLVFNQKCLLRTSLARRVLAGSRRTLFDFDDAIYTRPGRPHSFLTSWRDRRRLRPWLQEAGVVTAANQVLADYARQFRQDVAVIPMAVDLDIWKPPVRNDRPPRAVGPTVGPTIGWTGAPVNLPDLERLEPVLAAFLAKYPSARLAVSSGRKPRLQCPFDYHPFQPGAEPEFVRRLDIGLLPLGNDEFSRGKSPIKALQYLACGVPVVGNVFGATAEILNPSNSLAVSSEQDWMTALETLLNTPALIASYGRIGREFVQQHHDSKLVGEQLLQVMRG
jgi:glycosyltransferase involved in cell wall biosynthesis